ncbi:MAG: hypothetical protein ACREO8_06265 [Luteimonas sp.]
MTRKTLNIAIATALLGSLALVGCKREPEEAAVPAPAPADTSAAPAPMEPAPAPMAATASVSAVDLGNAIGSDMKVTAASTTFTPKDTIYASVTTASSDPAAAVPGKLAARWTFQDGQVVNEESRDYSFAGPGVTEFHISKPDGWPVGKYKLDISLDGASVQSRDFEVK